MSGGVAIFALLARQFEKLSQNLFGIAVRNTMRRIVDGASAQRNTNGTTREIPQL